MSTQDNQVEQTAVADSGLRALCAIAAYYRVPAKVDVIRRELALRRPSNATDILIGARLIQMKARRLYIKSPKRLRFAPSPAILERRAGGFVIFGGLLPNEVVRLIDPVQETERQVPLLELLQEIEPYVILIARKLGGPGTTSSVFGLSWFFQSIRRYRSALAHVVLATVVLQIFALIRPLFFQIIIDKVLQHHSYNTLYLVGGALIFLSIVECVLQYLRTYALSHTTNRIDVELGRRLFQHLLRLPLSYFESTAAGQTVARVRELENIRSFLTGQALFSNLDFVFASIMLGVLFLYSVKLTLVVVATIPLYGLASVILRPALRESIKDKFNTGAESQQFLVESIVGIQTLKSLAVEPSTRMYWEEKLAAYVKTSFLANVLGAIGQNVIQLISKISMGLVIFLGALDVMAGTLTVGELIAFNMISAQVMQPILRLSQLWQDFQQAHVSIERLGDILNKPTESVASGNFSLPRPQGRIEIKNVTFRYRPSGVDVLRKVSLTVEPGEVVGIVGPSGSGKSTLTKLLQRMYIPNEGQIFVDGIDVMHVDPAWLRSNIGVVLQENLLFNRTVHDNIALSNPAASRENVILVSKLSGADEFISKLERGYDTIIEERGANLSGGQRQRIAIARALITNPPILIFDEATSALDYESERIIQQNMRHIVKGRTVFIIAHRLSTVRHCNKIIGMKDGRVVETGTHSELLQRPDGLYARLWQLQSGQEE